MSLGDFRSVFMPYCLKKQSNGKYAVLNREYKPVGFFTTKHIKYDDFPVLVELSGIGPATAAKLSWNNSENTDEIFLYNDGCNPNNSDNDMKNYLEKLKTLAKLKIKQD